jgi:predicted Rossmann fold flavoprotein
MSVADARVQILGTRLEQRGPVLITHWGISGPAVLKLSAWGARVLYEQNYRAQILIDWLPDRREDEVRQQLHQLKIDRARQLIGQNSPFGLPSRLWKRLLSVAAIDEEQRWTAISKRQLAELLAHLKYGVYEVHGKGAFKEEFVTCGGVNLDEVNFKTMESRVCPGLYFAGEILDIDGVTGGFNFQAAWTTGWLAGRALAGRESSSLTSSSKPDTIFGR